MMILALSVATIYYGLTLGLTTSLRATRETEGLARVTQRLEDVLHMPYPLITTNNLPIEYVQETNKYRISLVYAMTTTVTTVFAPIEHKIITLDYTWGLGANRRYTRYTTLRTP